MLKLIATFLLIVIGHVHCSDSDNNICRTEEKFIELQEEKTTQPVRIRSHNWCLSFPPRCSNYRTEIHDAIKLQNVTKTKLMEHCCEGFNNINVNSNESLVCLPICRGGCRQGVCESPNQCVCDTGYEGRHCSQRCRPKMYGKNCKNICKCRNNSLCDHKSGFCRCTSGWIGKFCEDPCPKGHYGLMCQKRCQCNSKCDPENGTCLSENAKIVFDLSHSRSTGIMTLSSDRIKAKHWIPVNVNGKINFRNCSHPDRCVSDNGRSITESAEFSQNDVNKTALIQELNANLSNLTKALKMASKKTVAVAVNSSIAIHHVHRDVTEQKDLNNLPALSTELNTIETADEDISYDQDIEVDGLDQNFDQNSELYDEIDSIGGYNNVVHVFSISSINTTKSEQIQKLPPMVPVTLILLIVMCVSFILVFGAIYFFRRRKESKQILHTTTIHEDITLSDQKVQKPLPEIPSFTQSITRRLMQQDFYDRPSNNTSVAASTLGHSYAGKEFNRYDERGACDEHIYDEIKYSNYRETNQR